MSGQVNYLYWKLANFFISDGGFRLISVNEQKTELWLENRNHKKTQLIRLVRADIDWANPVNRDIYQATMRANRFGRSLFVRNIHLLNLYVSPFLPLDVERLQNQVKYPRGKTTVTTIMATPERYEQVNQEINQWIGVLPKYQLKETYEPLEIHSLIQLFMARVFRQEEEERKFFEYSKPFFTYVFMVIQIIVFLWMEMNGGSTNPKVLLKFGAKSTEAIIAGEWWRFITPMFLHIGIIHLVMNTIALYYLGTTVEKMFGRARFLWIYLISGFTGTLASFVFTPGLAAGASGAIFGCFGALLYLGVENSSLFFRTLGTSVITLIGINLLLGFLVPGIDNSGHIGGLIGGFIATGIVHFPKKRNVKLQSIFFVILTILVLFMLYYGYRIHIVQTW